MKSNLDIDVLSLGVPVGHPARRGCPLSETIHFEVRDDTLWLWDEGCQLQAEIYQRPGGRESVWRSLADLPHLDDVHRAFAEQATAHRGDMLGDHLAPWTVALDAQLAERDGSSVYFADAGGQVKIGWSKKVSQRLAQLQTGSASPIKLLGTMPGGLAVERRVHAKFAHLRLSGEWFTAAPELLAYVDEVSAR